MRIGPLFFLLISLPYKNSLNYIIKCFKVGRDRVVQIAISFIQIY